MAKMNGHIYFSKNQLNNMIKGKEVKFVREGKVIIAGLKGSHRRQTIQRLENRIEEMRKKLKDLGVSV